ncbi:hypothetical protein [Nocardia brasiliensis]|uniref:Uncharacterized protein n=1 Tax=Nocardia brasiliensis (strain ATCC 700358 / HUJEG-1) TaxID=1133849 RepID=K0EX01_NOCB7|nr:hypothetical protein [Nocardia brasiliensis]AFU02012.1 hypothetical protein O3I_020265 [Nocardia brasiliensis ATCC 700358]OCF87762.1 hypothetical protein AW168_25140 [Nocardia brasiliensis]
MNDPQQQNQAGEGDAVDVGFRLGGAVPPSAQAADSPVVPGADGHEPPADSDVPEPDPGDATQPAAARSAEEEQATESAALAERAVEEQAVELAHRIARELGVAGPEGWRSLEAVFALTVAGGVAYVLYYDDDEQVSRAEPPAAVTELVLLHRDVSAQLGDGPWWRMVVQLEATGEVEVDYDYGDDPFPDDQLLTAEAYQADLAAFPRERIPVWLAAYVYHDERQWRSPEQAAAQARADRDANIAAVLSRDDLPPLPVLWARWATIAAAFVAVGSGLGPRIRPSLGIFEGAARSGSTLFVLPGGRAVLSGGVWNAPELDAAYNDGAELPDLYAGAPDWVANQVLNARAAQGMLSFCYWWSNGSWHRADSPDAEQISAAVPGVWTTQTVADIVCGVAVDEPTEQQRQAAITLVAAAEAGVVTRDTLTALFDGSGDNIDGAMYQLSLAGLTATVIERLPQDRAISLVRAHILGLGVDTTGYPLDQLTAERLEVGWMVFVPTEPDEIAIGRALFYIADDGVIEQSSSSMPPSVYSEGFEQRFMERQTRTGLALMS